MTIVEDDVVATVGLDHVIERLTNEERFEAITGHGAHHLLEEVETAELRKLVEQQWLPLEGSPVQFIFPGEPGFEATQPLFECDALMSQADAPPLLHEAGYEP